MPSRKVQAGKERKRRIGRERRTSDTSVPPDAKHDWRAYFKAFCAEHGNWPVLWRERLLFEDGWSYSSTDHRGPEWRPPEDDDELRAMLLFYWRRRAEIVGADRNRVQQRLLDDQAAAGLRSAPLQVSWVEWCKNADGTSAAERKTAPADDLWLRGRLEWLEKDCRDCARKLRQLGVDERQVDALLGRPARVEEVTS